MICDQFFMILLQCPVTQVEDKEFKVSLTGLSTEKVNKFMRKLTQELYALYAKSINLIEINH